MPDTSKAEEGRLLYRVPEAAERMGVSTSYLYVLINAGRVPVVRISNRAVRIPVEALNNWVQQNTKGEVV